MKGKKIPLLIGRHVVLEYMKEGKSIDKIFLQAGLGGSAIQEMIQIARTEDIPISKVPVQKLDRLARGNHQGVVAFVSEVQFQKIENLIPHFYEQGITPLLLLLDGVTDVRNFGGIARSAEVMGAHAIVVPLKNSAPVSSDAIKTSAGALLRIPLCRTSNWKETIRELQMNGIQVVAAEGKATMSIREVNWKTPSALIMGAEGAGVSGDTLKTADYLVKIPQSGATESLNVSVACGIILYEASVQRTD